MNQPPEAVNEFVEFWNDTLAVKFNRFREILMNGLSHHSRVPLQQLDLAPGSKVFDVGCGWGETAIELAHMTGPQGQELGLDCVDEFLEKARADHAPKVWTISNSWPPMSRRTRSNPSSTSVFRALA